MHAHVDKIYLAYPSRPFAYNVEARKERLNPTSAAFMQELLALYPKTELVSGDWKTEEDMRNDCFSLAKESGFDWFLIQDADEFYSDSGWDIIKKKLSRNAAVDLYVTSWYNFWKQPYYVLQDRFGNIKGTNAGFALRCKEDMHFTRKRLTNAKSVNILDASCYHYGYVTSDDDMLEKIETWSHSNEVNKDFWYTVKWLAWQLDSKNLHPTNPTVWKRAIWFPLEQPSFFSAIDDCDQETIRLKVGTKLKEHIVDARSNVKYSLRKWKSAFNF